MTTDARRRRAATSGRRRLTLLAVVAVLVSSVVGVAAEPAAAASGAGEYHPLPPVRILDTRTGQGGVAGPVGAGSFDVTVQGVGGVPAGGVSAVVLNVTAVGPTATSSWLTVWPAGTARPTASNLNFVAGQTVPNLVTAKVGDNGKVSVYNQAGTVHVLFDVAGWYGTDTAPDGARYTPLTPARVLDTRTSIGGHPGALAAGETVNVLMRGQGGVPATGVSAVVVNATIVSATAHSFLTLYPTGGARPVVSNLNYSPGLTVPNLVVVKLGPDGQISAYNHTGTAHLIFDVLGWFGEDGATPGSTFSALPPARILDTRTTIGGLQGAVGAGATIAPKVTGVGGVPATGVEAVVVNATVTQPTGAGYVTLWPTGAEQPTASNLNFTPGQDVPNLAVVKVGAAGRISLFNAVGTSHLILDVVGWYSLPDEDGDGISDSADNCPAVANANQANLDGDGLGDVCDPDLDGDGHANAADNCPAVANQDQADGDGDGLGDACDDTTVPPGNNPPSQLDPGAATSVADAFAFLHSGTNPLQQSVAPGTISPARIAVLNGKVTGVDGTPIDGVEVSVLHHPELGRTFTRDGGRYDLAVNGARLDLVFEKDGLLPVQREVDAPWQDHLVVGDVVMIAPDSKVTVIDEASTVPFQVAQGSPGTGAGDEPATLLFPKEAGGTMEMPDGTTLPLGSMSVRATEFPPGGDASLPGTMPGNVGLTYAVEFTVDEAVAAGATSVAFDKPVLNYTSNFIGAPVGSPVPTAYYDREKGEWIPQPNGLVIRIVAESGGKADVDADKVAGADSPESLAARGITDAERQQLAALYDAGAELWRVPIPHFTPWDHNFPFGPPPDADPPRLKDFEWKDPNDPCNKRGSIIACETQNLAEEIPVSGTSMSLRYDSSRQPGFEVSNTVEVPITDGTVPSGLRAAEVTIDVAGRRFSKRWCGPDHVVSACRGYDPLAPDLRYTLEWDGTDSFGRPVVGRPLATVKVTYVYQFVYYPAPEAFEASFGAWPQSTQSMDGRAYCRIASGGSISLPSPNLFYCGILATETIQKAIGSWPVGEVAGLGGLTLSAHHGYDPAEKVVHRGDGGTIRTEPLGAVTRTVAGCIAGGPCNGFPTTAPTPATSTDVDYLTDIGVGPDGSVYGHSGLNQNRIWQVDPTGTIRVIGGKERGTTNADRGQPTGDGGPATEAVLGGTEINLDVGPDGSVYFTVEGPYPVGYIRRIRPDGIIETIAGVPWSSSTSSPVHVPAGSGGDGGPARQARLNDPLDLEVGPDGSIYFGERGGHTNGNKAVVRRIAPDGTISRVAGGGVDLPAGHTDDEDLGAGEPALAQALGIPYGLAATDDGSLYITDPTARVVQRVGTDGRIRRVAGDHTRAIDLGEVGTTVGIGEPTGVAVDRNGDVVLRTNDTFSPGSDVKIVRIDATGAVQPEAGSPTALRCTFCRSPEGEPANGTLIEANSLGIETLPDGTVLYADGRYTVRVIEAALPGFGLGSIIVPSEDASELFEFERSGRHRRTIDPVTGATQWHFSYDAAGRLVGITDVAGNTTQIQRAANGSPEAIVAPGEQRTSFTLDSLGRMETVANPAQEVTRLGYGADGLLASFARPGRPPSTFTFDADGRLVRDQSSTGAEQTLDRAETDTGITVTHTSGEGRVTTYLTATLPNGDRVRAITRPSGARTEMIQRPNGTRVVTDPDFTTTTTMVEPDPRWGMRAPVPAKEVVTTPGGRTRTTEVFRSATLANKLDPLSVVTLTTTINRSVTGLTTRSESSTYTASNRTITHSSGSGKLSTAKLDDRGRVIEIDPDGSSTALVPMKTAFGPTGLVTKIEHGAQSWTYAYDASRRLVSRLDAKNQETTYAYDAADRIAVKTLPGDRAYRYGWRSDGALDSLTVPSGAVYDVDADEAGRSVALRPPETAAPYVRTLDQDGGLDLLTMPTGASRDVVLDPTTGLESASLHGPERDDTTYHMNEERPSRLARTPTGGTAQVLDMTYDGPVPATTAASGQATGTYAYTYDSFFDLTGVKLTSGADVVDRPYEYDRDGHATRAGAFTLARTGPAGRLGAMGDGTLSTAYLYDSLGRMRKRTLTAGGGVRYATEVAYGTTGQVATRTETVDGATRTLTYEYDQGGRLTIVKEGAAVLESYGYDDNGNRNSRTLGAGPAEPAAYNRRDQLTSRGATTYAFDDDGFLTARGGASFDYSPSGALLSATVGGTTIRYGYDSLGRRVSRTDAGGTEQYLYGDPANPFLVTASRSSAGVLTTYTYDEEDALVALERGGTRYYVGSDQVGSPRVVFSVDAAGAATVARRISYDSFGTATPDPATPGFDLPIGFAGGLADPVTGLVRFGLRDYDPASGRFTARDPAFFSGSPTNLYAYANSDPLSLRDPTGLWCVGGSFYAGVGGGISFCNEDGKSSICAEGGVGAGGGVEVDPFGGPAETGTSLQAEATAKYGPVAATVGFETDLDCFNTKGSVKGTAFGVSAGIDTNGDLSGSVGGSSKDDFTRGERNQDNSWGKKVEGKIAVRGCGRF